MAEYATKTTVILPSGPGPTVTFLWRHIVGLGAEVFCHRLNDACARLFPADVKWYRGTKDDARPQNWLSHKLHSLRCEVLGSAPATWSEDVVDAWVSYVDERRPDVALAEFGPTALAALDACKRTQTPLVAHFHGFDATAAMRFPQYRRALRELFEYANAVVVVGRFMVDVMVKEGCPREKLHLIPCGAPVDECPVSYTVARQPCRFIAVSSFKPMKGIFYTLKAFDHCHSECPDTSLTMIGQGHEWTKARAWVTSHSLDDAINLAGIKPNDAVLSDMRVSSVFVQHSRTARTGYLRRGYHLEGWGVSIAEAAACGLPVVATNHGGIPDHVIDGETGFLVPEGDWRAMGERMIQLARNPKLRKRMGPAGRRNIEKVGNRRIQIEKLRALLESVVHD